MRVPDHGRLAPWRFLLIQGEPRQRISEKLCARKLALDPEINSESLEKERQRFLQVPRIVVVIAQITKAHKIPEVEQLLSAGAVCMQLLNAAAAHGFAGQWLTGCGLRHRYRFVSRACAKRVGCGLYPLRP